jgi:hypothetical protein
LDIFSAGPDGGRSAFQNLLLPRVRPQSLSILHLLGNQLKGRLLPEDFSGFVIQEKR